jgi:8-oxo-dGTP diphosphatase
VPVVAVGGIAVMGGALLLVQRAHPPGEGLWSVPGGRLEPGESVTTAVERELLEETALGVRCGTLVGFAERRDADHHFVILDFEVTVTGSTTPTAGSDARAVAWVPLTEVTSLPLVEGLEEFLVGHGVLR